MRNGHIWHDIAGNPIQAHGGWILPHEGSYLWYGEDYGPDGTCQGIHLYRSYDLGSWEDCGIVFAAAELKEQGLSVLERPRVLFDVKRGRFVLWMHVDDAGYQKAELAVAASTEPEGPFGLVRAVQPEGEDVRDFTLWETEGSFWLIAATDANKTLRIWQLDETLEDVRPGGTCIREGQERESPCAFDWAGSHFLLTSGCAGWRPNAALLARSEEPSGPWQLLDNPCEGRSPLAGPHETFGGQASCVFEADGQLVALLDHWAPRNLGASGYSLLALAPSHARHPMLSLPWSAESFRLSQGRGGAGPKFRSIILTDAANEADDQFAIAGTLLSPSIEVRSIIAEHFGEPGSMKASFDDAARVANLVGEAASGVPIYAGCKHPLDGGEDPLEIPGVKALVEEVRRDDARPLYLLAMGALSDVALALRCAPELAEHAVLVWVGGGRYPQGGHEANLHRDIRAAQEVYASKLPIWQIPVGTYKELQISLAELECRIAPLGTLGAYLAAELQLFQERMRSRASWIPEESWVLGDLAAPGVLLDARRDLYESVPAPQIGDDGSYLPAGPNARTIRVYRHLGSRFLIEDLIAKLARRAEQERTSHA